MNIAQSILNFLNKKDRTGDETPKGFCPNCWGREEYGGEFYTAVKKADLDINKSDLAIGWIQSYANKNLDGIALKHEGDDYVCSKCKVTYRQL